MFWRGASDIKVPRWPTSMVQSRDDNAVLWFMQKPSHLRGKKSCGWKVKSCTWLHLLMEKQRSKEHCSPGPIEFGATQFGNSLQLQRRVCHFCLTAYIQGEPIRVAPWGSPPHSFQQDMWPEHSYSLQGHGPRPPELPQVHWAGTSSKYGHPTNNRGSLSPVSGLNACVVHGFVTPCAMW